MNDLGNLTLEVNQKIKDKPSKAYKIASVILMVLWAVGCVFITALLIACVVEARAEGGWAWVGFALIFALSIIFYVVVVVLALSGLITTIIYRNRNKDCKLIGYLVSFIVFTALPIISEIVFYLVATLIN